MQRFVSKESNLHINWPNNLFYISKNIYHFLLRVSFGGCSSTSSLFHWFSIVSAHAHTHTHFDAWPLSPSCLVVSKIILTWFMGLWGGCVARVCHVKTYDTLAIMGFSGLAASTICFWGKSKDIGFEYFLSSYSFTLLFSCVYMKSPATFEP